MKTSMVFVGIVFLIVSAVAFAGAADRGAENIKIYGGSRGDVPFPHRDHQDRLEDCSTCHAVFPKETGSIKNMKTAGQLQKKQPYTAFNFHGNP